MSVAERVDHIAGMMERLEWQRGKSARELAKTWGCSVSTVENYSAEAHRRMVADRDEAVRDISVGARRLYIDAVNNGDAKAAKMMGDLWADVAGAKAPIKQELGVTAASPAAASRLVREAFGDKVIGGSEDSSEPPAIPEESPPE